jgi:hypothetical protein
MRIERSLLRSRVGDGLDGLIGIHKEFVEPAIGVTQGFGEDRTRPNSHWADRRARLTFAWNDLAALVRRGRYPGNGECLNLPIDGDGLAKPDLDFLCADCDSLDRGEHLLMNGELLAWLNLRGVRADRPTGNTHVRQRQVPRSSVWMQ